MLIKTNRTGGKTSDSEEASTPKIQHNHQSHFYYINHTSVKTILRLKDVETSDCYTRSFQNISRNLTTYMSALLFIDIVHKIKELKTESL